MVPKQKLCLGGFRYGSVRSVVPQLPQGWQMDTFTGLVFGAEAHRRDDGKRD